MASFVVEIRKSITVGMADMQLLKALPAALLQFKEAKEWSA